MTTELFFGFLQPSADSATGAAALLNLYQRKTRQTWEFFLGRIHDRELDPFGRVSAYTCRLAS